MAAAIWLGGPGAVFWMWISALLGLSTGCVEKLLAVKYQVPAPGGGLQGGPMFYLRDGLRAPKLAAWFSLACLPAALAGGGLIQSSSIASALSDAFGMDRLFAGCAAALLAGLVLFGGVGRIARVSQRAGARHGPAVSGVRCPGALGPAGGTVPGLCPDLLLCPDPGVRPGRRRGIRPVHRPAPRGGPGRVHQRGGTGHLRHGPRGRSDRLPRPAGHVGNLRGVLLHPGGVHRHRSGDPGQRGLRPQGGPDSALLRPSPAPAWESPSPPGPSPRCWAGPGRGRWP